MNLRCAIRGGEPGYFRNFGRSLAFEIEEDNLAIEWREAIDQGVQLSTVFTSLLPRFSG